MTRMSRTLVGGVTAAALAVSSATPALARDRDRDGIDVGDVIAGAVILGGIAAVASSIGDNDRYDRDYAYGGAYNDGYGYRGNYRSNPRQAVEQCVAAAQQSASRYSYGGADVTDIRQVSRSSRGYTVRGRIAVNSAGRGWSNGDRYYGRGWGGDYRGFNNSLRGYDSGTFQCRVEYGRVVDLDFDGVRGL